uniref:Uncharacterized protein n=1 Tax=uncultured bacterium pFosLip TaxID=380391 RepID=Q1KL79_9BACT|nr:hypothetical protein [uncultured bacterium pFosLip]
MAVEMRKQGQAIRLAVRDIDVIVDDAPVSVHARQRSRDITDTAENHRDRPGGNDRVFDVVRADANALQWEAANVEERGEIACVEKQGSLEECGQQTAINHIERGRRQQGGAENRPLVECSEVAGTYGQDVRAQHRMIENLPGAGVTQQDAQNLTALGRYLVNIGPLAVALLYVRVFEAFDRGKRILLSVAGKAPGADRRADEVYRTG